MLKYKKAEGTTGQVIGLFIMILVIITIAGMAFLFISSLKTQVELTDTTTLNTVKVANETGFVLNYTQQYFLETYGKLNPVCSNIVVINQSGNQTIESANYSTSGATGNCGIIKEAVATTNFNNSLLWISYDYTVDQYGNAYTSINSTETAGSTIVDYLPLLFLAIIFGVILAVVLKIILPYINLGQQVGSF